MEQKKIDPLLIVTSVCSGITIIASIVTAIVSPKVQENIIDEKVTKAVNDITNK